MYRDSHGNNYYNEDCIEGMRCHISSDSIDLILTDPPYGIGGDSLHKHYNRDESFVRDGYVEVSEDEYPQFSEAWILEAARVLRPGGSIYIVSGYTNLFHVLYALRSAGLKEQNHLIWKYNFGVFTRNKFVSSHYHILYYIKDKGNVTFNTGCRYGITEKGEDGGSLNYQDREDVFVINREYKPGKVKNKNELPVSLLVKLLQYSSNPGDIVLDPFLGGFSTAEAAIGLGRKVTGFELAPDGFTDKIQRMSNIPPCFLTKEVRTPANDTAGNRWKSWTSLERSLLFRRYDELQKSGEKKGKIIQILCIEFGRGHWAITKALKKGDFDSDNIISAPS